MSRGGQAEGMAHLRGVIAKIEARFGPAPARGSARVGQKLSLTRALDRVLGGGLADDALH